MRGAPVVGLVPRDGRGIIPAHAGSTSRTARSSGCPRDHPRACGEHLAELRAFIYPVGSSPRMRGAQVVLADLGTIERIIPAHAGSTRYIFCFIACAQDHPRACGEHGSSVKSNTIYTGSSPRMRGALGNCDLITIAPGIIPAHAGSTVLYSFYRNRGRDHPRACGEHIRGRTHRVPCLGSSPRMRGAQPLVGVLHVLHGIIPAHAGSTLKHPSSI